MQAIALSQVLNYLQQRQKNAYKHQPSILMSESNCIHPFELTVCAYFAQPARQLKQPTLHNEINL